MWGFSSAGIGAAETDVVETAIVRKAAITSVENVKRIVVQYMYRQEIPKYIGVKEQKR